jgi:hypothetical protein
VTTGSPPARARSPRRWAVLLVLVLAAAAVAVGVWLLMQPAAPSSFGWFAYSPMSDTTFTPAHDAVDPLGLGLVVVGALTLGGLGGYTLGGRQHR